MPGNSHHSFTCHNPSPPWCGNRPLSFLRPVMSRRSSVIAAVVLTLLLATSLLWRPEAVSGKTEPLGPTTFPPRQIEGPEILPAQPAAVPAPAPAPPSAQAALAEPAVGNFVPGHFPGVSVSHEPGTHRPTPPDGTPRTVPKEQEIILPDGRRLIGVTLDETWRVPLRAKADP